MSSPVISIFAVGDYDAQIDRAADILRSGGLVVLPTETAYGVAGLLNHAEARRRLGEFRGETAQPFTLHLANAADAHHYLGEVSDLGRRLMRKLWPGPVSLIFDVPAERRAAVAKSFSVAESDLFDPSGAVTLRCPRHIVFSDVVSQVQGPMAMTLAGAGASGSHWSAKAAAEELGGRVDLILDAGPTDYAKPSTMLKVGADKYEIVRPGIWDERIIDRMLKTTVLFVCSGNTCRSPMAEAIARHYLASKLGVGEAELEKRGLSVLSAGSFAMPGVRATPQAVEAVRTLGADLSHHRSKPLSIDLIHQADHIFTMSRNHAAAVVALSPAASDKVSTLDPTGDIEDPIGGNSELYIELAGHLQTLIEKRLAEKSLP